LAAIEAARMMLKHLGEDKAAVSIQDAVAKTTKKIKSLGAGKMGYSTSEVGDMVAGYITERKK
jgi:3-isopropylmalate dehydrogenase